MKVSAKEWPVTSSVYPWLSQNQRSICVLLSASPFWRTRSAIRDTKDAQALGYCALSLSNIPSSTPCDISQFPSWCKSQCPPMDKKTSERGRAYGSHGSFMSRW